jgi:hypothetical protein
MGQGPEGSWTWRINDFSAYVGNVGFSKNVHILNHEKQKSLVARSCNNIVNFSLVNYQVARSLLSRPICRDRWRPNIFSALVYDITNGAAQIAIASEDDADGRVTSARARGGCWSLPIISEMVTENRGSIRVDLGRESISRRSAIYRMGSQPEIDWPNIGAELAVLGFAGDSGGLFGSVSEAIGPGDGSLSILSGNPHLGQLTAHRIPLEQRSEKRQYSYSGDYSGPNDQLASDRREPTRFPYKRIFLGICVIGLGWTCLWFSFESFEKVSKSPRHLAGGIVLGLVAIALIGHGLFYACLGVWGLPSLYTL